MESRRRIARPAFPTAVHLILRQQDKVLFLQRLNTGYEDGKWSLPAGHIEYGEPATAAVRRESMEELGIGIQPDQLRFVLAMHKKDPVDGEERIDFFFECTEWSGLAENREPEKAYQVRWFKLNEIAGLCTVGYIAVALDMVQEGLVYGEFGWS